MAGERPEQSAGDYLDLNTEATVGEAYRYDVAATDEDFGQPQLSNFKSPT